VHFPPKNVLHLLFESLEYAFSVNGKLFIIFLCHGHQWYELPYMVRTIFSWNFNKATSPLGFSQCSGSVNISYGSWSADPLFRITYPVRITCNWPRYFFLFSYIFWLARVCWPLLCLRRLVCIRIGRYPK
jgi:hypothetical protein